MVNVLAHHNNELNHYYLFSTGPLAPVCPCLELPTNRKWRDMLFHEAKGIAYTNKSFFPIFLSVTEKKNIVPGKSAMHDGHENWRK